MCTKADSSLTGTLFPFLTREEIAQSLIFRVARDGKALRSP